MGTVAGVTRLELYYAIDSAFRSAPVQRVDLLVAARERGARPEVLSTLEELPADVELERIRDLWSHYPSLPPGH